MAVLDFNGFQRAISLDFISQKFILKNFQDQTVLDSLVQILDDEPTTVKQVQRLSKQLYKLLYNRIFEYDIISHLDGDIKINIDNVIISISAQVASRNRYLMKTLLDLFFND
ncbi:hypothetical protein SS50377_22150 [Spironucleus salmonicida]|uniref:Uncharacterized protein n=1 Tax=Spironucleus salmonicida TaxID=348837 RepID=V6LPR0_9EUKA|nr:hypothetical protein SS50377_22150 [Spironucleus salmonicida]|eukprot:EST45691.1 Hypothetical protein SS50377_14262 [Spironucleus salmonicida]